MYAFGPEKGDIALTPACDDCAFGPITLPTGSEFVFFGKKHSIMYVGSNGFVSFDVSSTSFTPEAFPLLSTTLAVVAPWWSDVDLNGGNYTIQGYSQVVNSIYLRTGNSASDIARVQQVRVRYRSAHDHSLKSTVAPWFT